MPDNFRTDRLDWDGLRYFLTLARQGSLSAAARALGVNHATVSRRLGQLEEGLGAPLFDRRPQGYVLTPRGSAILAEAEAMEQAALGVLRRFDSETGPAGLVRLTATATLTTHFLAERLGPLSRAHPALDLEILTDTRALSLGRREADLALRIGRPVQGDLICRRMAAIGLGLYGTAEWRTRVAAGEPPPFIGFDPDSLWIGEAAALEAIAGRHRVILRSNNQLAQAAAARAGLGIAQLPHFLGARDPGLVPIAFGPPVASRELWLLIRPELASVPRVRAVIDFLTALFERERQLLEGTVNVSV